MRAGIQELPHPGAAKPAASTARPQSMQASQCDRACLQGFVDQYLAALAEEHAFDGVRFDKLAMRQARREEAPAQLMFELGATGLDFPTPEIRK